jgi:hypothetical protein
MPENLPTNNPSDFLFPKSTLDEVTRPKIMFQRVQKRDGTLVDFNKSKITNAIFAAAQSVGGKDRELAEHTADLVILYLARNYPDGLLNVEQIQDAVENVLIENGHARTSKAFIIYREKRAQLRKMKAAQASSAESCFELQKGLSPADTPKVQTANETTSVWNRQKIVDALTRETGLDTARAQSIAIEIEKQIIYSRVQIVTVGLIRELVNAKLIEYGLYREQQMHSRLGIPVYDTEQILCRQETEQTASPETAEHTLVQELGRQYSFIRIYNQDIVAAQHKEQIHISGIKNPARYLGAVLPLEYFIESGLRIFHRNLYQRPPANFAEFCLLLSQAGFQGEDYAFESLEWPEFSLVASKFAADITQENLLSGFRSLMFHLNGTYRNTQHRFHLYFSEIENNSSIKVSLAFLKAYFMGDDIGSRFSKILPVLHLDSEMMQKSFWAELAAIIQKTLAEGRPLELQFPSNPDKAVQLISGRITLNPLTAAKEAEGNTVKFEKNLREQIQWAVLAHGMKHRFFSKMSHANGKGVLCGYNQWLHGAGMNPATDTRFLIAIPDLFKTARAMGLQADIYPAAYGKWALELLAKLKEMIIEESWKSGLNCELEPEVPDYNLQDSSENNKLLPLSPLASALWGPLTMNFLKDAESGIPQAEIQQALGEAACLFLRQPEINLVMAYQKEKGIRRIRLMP